MSIGVQSLITELSSGIVVLAFNIIILGLAGNTGVAAYAVIANTSIVAVSIFTVSHKAVSRLSVLLTALATKTVLEQC